MEEVSCIDSECIECCRSLEVLTAILTVLCDLQRKLEVTGLGRRRLLADCAENISLDVDPVALGTLIEVNKVSALVDKDQITGLTAVALCLSVVSVRIRNSTVCADLVFT